MDLAALGDICFAIGAVLGAALMVYGAWLSLPINHVQYTKASRDEKQSEAVVRKPRPRVRAGTGERELRRSQGRV